MTKPSTPTQTFLAAMRLAQKLGGAWRIELRDGVLVAVQDDTRPVARRKEIRL